MCFQPPNTLGLSVPALRKVPVTAVLCHRPVLLWLFQQVQRRLQIYWQNWTENANKECVNITVVADSSGCSTPFEHISLGSVKPIAAQKLVSVVHSERRSPVKSQ